LFVEFTDEHYRHLEPFLKKYPYSNKMVRSKAYAGNMVFSKLQIDNWADDFPQWARKYGYFSVMLDTTPLYIYLVHMSSPVSHKSFLMRNSQIEKFFKDFDLHKDIHRERQDKVIVIWDFNTSPWSVFYRNFARGFAHEFVNITRLFPILFTRSLNNSWIFWSHIDHIFVDRFVSVSDLRLLDIVWSDHKWFSFLIK
jgi:endonuclease/exonuclease/phosphatase family metal-dependent hydrolase